MKRGGVSRIMTEKKVVVRLKKGIQGRTAAQFVELASSFNSEIMIIKQERLLSAKSIIGVMGAAISPKEEIILTARGSDEQRAIRILQEFLSTEEIDINSSLIKFKNI